ncbi:uncharacterized protein LOC112456414 [Temnothorax curvispinosus]|uniref:Uncharacterized protein LOC112456414 n=1 Tax=Temnothorax curvispinosus TaxID=300111 RepID=A0A6J1PZ65_9HYME|nr:uncharacterized protein LOC112456414 [Temnothorax curvispinosus]
MLIDILLANGYPFELVFKIVKKRMIKLINEQQRGSVMDAHATDSMVKDRFFVVPYINKITNSFCNTIKKFNLRTAIVGLNKLSWIIKPLKDKLHNNFLSGVVYKICCQDCDASYVGQTKRQLGTRIKEHRNQLSRNPRDLSVVSQHRLEGHEFDWDNVLIMDRERSYLRRSISEMFYIKRQNNGINLQEDTAGLSNNYTPVIEGFPHC